ncbi:MAG: WbqC family protein [Bacteroidales bacterium]|nr:WbqC family protein [Bacteroidales bacterium]
MKIAIMQPYFLPYIGYFQLIKAVDTFIFYDDVNFINRGWINRNNFLINGQKRLLTLPCEGASQNILINQIELILDEKTISKILKSIRFSYNKAPYFLDVFALFEKVLRYENKNLARFTANSVMKFCKYLSLPINFKFSSKGHPETKGMGKADRLIEITKREGLDEYVNPIGGQEIYTKDYFKQNGIELLFLATNQIEYNQFKNNFIPWLSIIDVLMFNSVEETNALLSKYKLV